MDRLAGGYGRRQYAASAEDLEKGVVSFYLARVYCDLTIGRIYIILKKIWNSTDWVRTGPQ